MVVLKKGRRHGHDKADYDDKKMKNKKPICGLPLIRSIKDLFVIKHDGLLFGDYLRERYSSGE